VSISTEKIVNLLLPTLIAQYQESQPAFRASTALALCEMAPIVGKDTCVQKILPILQELLKDDNSEVRLNVAQNIGKLAGVVGDEVLTPALVLLL
jgi:serine/threonine-protein phosphatase 2A regulatory subunit A